MSYPHPPTLTHLPSTPHAAPLPWEPALTQLRALAEPERDRLVTHWLSTIGLTSIRPRQRAAHAATYQTILGRPPFSTPVHIRVYQRKNELQAHHVDAFAGYLQRMGVPGGLVITTGGCSREAILIAGASQTPRICLLSGEQWAALLAQERSGLRRVRFPRWVLDLTRTLRSGGRYHQAPGGDGDGS